MLLALTGEGVAGGGSVLALVPGLVVAGVGMGLLFAPLVGVTLSTLSPARAGEASGVVSTVQQLGGAVGVALLGVVFYGVLGGPTPRTTATPSASARGAWPGCRSSSARCRCD